MKRYFEIAQWLQNAVRELTDEQLICQAINEDKKICLSPAVFAEIERRKLGGELQHRINPHIAYGALLR